MSVGVEAVDALKRIVRMTDRRLFLFAPLVEARPVQQDVAGEIGIVRTERGAGQRPSAGHEVAGRTGRRVHVEGIDRCQDRSVVVGGVD